MFRQSYTVEEDETVALSGAPVRVEQRIIYEPIVLNQENAQPVETKKGVPSDMTLIDPETPVPESGTEEAAPVEKLETKTVKALSVDDILENVEMPDDVRELISNAQVQVKAKRGELTQAILNVEGNALTQEYLDAQPVDILTAISNMAAKPQPQSVENQEEMLVTPNFGGLAPVQNASDEEPLPIPSL